MSADPPPLPPATDRPRPLESAAAGPYGGSLEVAPGVEIGYRVRGMGPRTVVVPSESWVGPDMAPLSDGRCCVFYDLRGRGRSSTVEDESQLGLERDVADLEALRRELGIERLALVGWSYHGALAARYALAYADRVERLVLVAPTAPVAQPFLDGFLERFTRRLDLAELARLDRQRREGLPQRRLKAWSEAMHELHFKALVADPECLARRRANPAVAPNLDAERVNRQSRRVLEALGPYDWRRDFGDFDVPTLVIHGSEDPVMPEGSELWAAILPRARLLALEGVGHLPWLERPDLFFPAVRSFLSGRWPEGASEVEEKPLDGAATA